MKGVVPFDAIAEQYDSMFTTSMTGQAQRGIVRHYLERRLIPASEVLEINCGTGEDAFFIAGLNCRVLATDASAGMIRQCMDKSHRKNGEAIPEFLQAGIGELASATGGKKFDIIFSNFSGLNCIDEKDLKGAARFFETALKPGGHLIVVLFSTNCLWEKFYFLLKGRKSDINRRKSKPPVFADLLGSSIPVYYYSPKQIGRLFKAQFRIVKTRPVGVFLPPSYLDPFFRRRPFLFRLLVFADRVAGSFPFLANFADHFLIEFKKP
jgi:ubiquinone/menaquinone biosynthesis C-methylase UbiE